MELDQVRYAGFWRRFASLLLDIVIMSPLAAVAVVGQGHYRLFDVYELVPLVLFGLWFNVYLVGRFGGTPGKLILGLRIVKLSGEAASHGAAFMRNLPSFVLDAIWRVGFAMALLHMTDAEYFALDPHHRYAALERMAAPWYHWVKLALAVWFWSELVVLLTNKKRRAIHDFIAGTVVIQAPPPPRSSPRSAAGWAERSDTLRSSTYVLGLAALHPADDRCPAALMARMGATLPTNDCSTIGALAAAKPKYAGWLLSPDNRI